MLATLFTNIFSQSISCLSVLFMASFAVQKPLSLIRSHLFLFVFISFALGAWLRKHCYDLCQRTFCPCLLLRVLCILSYIQAFRPFWVYFCLRGVRGCSNFIDLSVAIQLSLEGLMVKLKLQYFGHLMRRADSFEKTLMLGKIKGRRKRGWQRLRWLASPTQWTWVWVNSGDWWWTGRPGVLWFMGLHRVGHDWVTKVN